MDQMSMFKDKAEVGDTVYLCGRKCTVTKKEHHDPEQNGGEIFYTIHDPTGRATHILNERHFSVEPPKEE
jgi:hypothetical protein